MATLEQVMEALRKADGLSRSDPDNSEKHIEAAKRFALIANRMRASTPSTDKRRKNYGIVPFINRGLTAGLPAQQTIEKGLNTVGSLFGDQWTPPAGRGPETLPEYAGYGLGQAAAFLIPVGATTKLLAGGAGLPGKVANTIWQAVIKHPWISMASEATGGLGAGTGRGVAEQEFPDNPTASVVGETVGGLTGGMAPSIVRNTPVALSLRHGKSVLQKLSLPFTEKGAKYRAGEFIKSKASNVAQSADTVTEATIGDLPPAIALGEKRITQLYKNFIGQDPKTDMDTIEKLSRSMIKLEGEMRRLGYGSPELLAEITRKRVAALELRMDKRIMSAMSSAKDKVDALPVARRKTAESKIVRGELESAMRADQSTTNALWRDVPKDMEVEFSQTREAFGAIEADLAKAQRGDIPAALKQSPIIIDDKLEITTIREMQGLRSKLLENARMARKNGQWNRARIASEVADAIMDDIEVSAMDSGSSSLKAAIASTKQFKTKYEQGIVGKILGYSKTGAPAIDPDLTLDISIGRMGTKGSIDIDKVAVTPEAIAATKKYLARSFTDFATDKKTGTINTTRAESWIKSNEAILDKFPDMRSQLDDIYKAQSFADRTRITMQARKKALQDKNVSVAARFLNSVDLGVEIDSLLKSRNPSRMVSDLVLKARRDTTGEALAGLRGGFVDNILEKSAIGSFNEQGERTLSGRSMLDYISKNMNTLQKVFTPEQMYRMRRIGSELYKVEMFDKMHPGKVELDMKDVSSSALKMFSRVGGAQIGRWVAGITGGGTVQTPGIFSERFQSFAKYLSKDRAMQMIHDAVVSDSPELLQALLLPISKPTTKAGATRMKILDSRLNAWLAGTGSRVMDDIINEQEEQSQQ